MNNATECKEEGGGYPQRLVEMVLASDQNEIFVNAEDSNFYVFAASVIFCFIESITF